MAVIKFNTQGHRQTKFFNLFHFRTRILLDWGKYNILVDMWNFDGRVQEMEFVVQFWKIFIYVWRESMFIVSSY